MYICIKPNTNSNANLNPNPNPSTSSNSNPNPNPTSQITPIVEFDFSFSSSIGTCAQGTSDQFSETVFQTFLQSLGPTIPSQSIEVANLTCNDTSLTVYWVIGMNLNLVDMDTVYWQEPGKTNPEP